MCYVQAVIQVLSLQKLRKDPKAPFLIHGALETQPCQSIQYLRGRIILPLLMLVDVHLATASLFLTLLLFKFNRLSLPITIVEEIQREPFSFLPVVALVH